MKRWYVQGKYGLTPRGEYSITCNYLDLTGKQPRLASTELIYRVIMWLASQNRLLTKDRLLKLNIPVEESECCLCAHQVPENPMHLFVECSWINVVRTWIEQWTGATLYDRELSRGLINLKNKQWKQFKKGILEAV
ncbi:hypothetical protein KY290_004030 [Solanum tuberosum]|uniref:Reverse transcriptase zinc-binding domain-containing protein n=1 Tax=Solanum tuberosum TaxID=4113 RepID=A0ABQ7WUK5_SOLTU|nr:hypothetical protein KY284_002227 [Solanum tuberosum]KAH0731149.1 hypothetical protein KY289_002337 [Solanum tuberosum]KAH0766198.1 hypothetical protein KY285_002069 [Solanum tuberosum]KAH0784432.1 hypothetical protein KY290_004030 [Solanum tuberosum]